MKGRLSWAPLAVLGAAGAAAMLAAAVLVGSQSEADLTMPLTILVAGLPGIAACGFAAAKRPEWIVPLVIGLMAFSGSLAANQGIHVKGIIWVLLAGLLAATVVSYLNPGRSRTVLVWPGVVALGAYFLFSALQIPFAESTEIGARAFVAGPALMVAFFAFAFAQWNPETRWRIAQGFIVVALLAGAYALFRLFVGPTAAETSIVRQSAGVAGDLALFGSFPGRHELGAWSAVAVPCLFSLALVSRGRWRAVAGAAAALMIVALLGSELRTALIGAAIGILVAVVLFQGARAVRGEAHFALIAVAGLAVVGMVGFGLTVGSDPESAERFGRITSPGEDFSFQQRLQKWDAALAQINENPLGQGLGTAGSTQRNYSRTYRLDNKYIDNSYLQLGVQQGYPGWILFAIAVLLTGYKLARSSVATPDRRLGAIGIGATSALASWLVILLSGDMLTAWGALLLWMLLGLAVGGFVTVTPLRSRARTAS